MSLLILCLLSHEISFAGLITSNIMYDSGHCHTKIVEILKFEVWVIGALLRTLSMNAVIMQLQIPIGALVFKQR